MEKVKPHFSERLKNYVEVTAIVLGGLWALYNFVLKDSPMLALRRKASSTLTWNNVGDKNNSKAEFNVTLENIGTSVFYIKKAHLSAWICKEVKLKSGENAVYIDVHKLEQSGSRFFDTTYTFDGNDSISLGLPFIGRYNADAIWNENFEFLLKPDANKIILFYITFYENGHENEPFDWTYQWDYAGGTDNKRRLVTKN